MKLRRATALTLLGLSIHLWLPRALLARANAAEPTPSGGSSIFAIPGPPSVGPKTVPRNEDSYLVYHDDSDWWSLLPNSTSLPLINLPSQRNARFLSSEMILGFPARRISVDAGEKIQDRMGDGYVVVRPGKGDADAEDYRRQLCYESASGRVKLIFEDGGAFEGEEQGFYLFTGRDWKGSERCKKSRLVKDDLATKGGLRLGMTREQVETILGRPSAVGHDTLKYSYHTVPLNPEGADGYDVMVVRFTEARVSYIGVLSAVGD